MINFGNFGGLLMNFSGEFVGINIVIVSNFGSNEGVGFVILINMVMWVVRDLIDEGFVFWVFFGVFLDN